MHPMMRVEESQFSRHCEETSVVFCSSLSDRSGRLSEDFSGFNNTGTLTGGIAAAGWAVSSKYSTVNLDGAAGYVLVGDSDELNIGLSDMTILARIRTTAASSGTPMFILGKANVPVATIKGYGVFVTSTGKLGISLGTGLAEVSAVNDAGSIDDLAEHHIAISIDRSALCKRYIDGAPSGTNLNIAALAAVDLDYTNVFSMGSTSQGGSPAFFFQGHIWNCFVFLRVLSAEEIRAHYERF